MAANRHATALSMEDDKMAAFANGRKSSPLELLTAQLSEAKDRPDVRPSEQGRGGTVAPIVPKEEIAEPQAIAPVVASPIESRQPEPAAQPEFAPPPQARQPEAVQPPVVRSEARTIEDDGTSYRVPPNIAEEVNRGGRPRHGAERKVERTISMDKSLDKILLNLAIIESVRLGRRVSSAEVAVHLMQYGLSNMRDNQILPGDDGLGLAITSAAPTAVALPKIGGDLQ